MHPPHRAAWPQSSAAALLLATFLVAGCSTSSPAGRTPSRPDETVLLDESVIGRIVSVNPGLRYAVMDFPVRCVPVVDQLLHVYRQGQRVGRIRITGPILGTAAAGDIIEGQAALNDEVRED